MEKIKIYGNVRKISDDYCEVDYREYIDGELVNEGTEDFSPARLRNQTIRFDVYKHTGRINRGGGKMTEWVGTLRTSKNACRTKVARMIYGEIARVEKMPS